MVCELSTVVTPTCFRVEESNEKEEHEVEKQMKVEKKLAGERKKKLAGERKKI